MAEALFSYTLREARGADLPHILAIYNHYVTNSTVTFDEAPLSLRELRAKFQHQVKLGMPYLVAESPGGDILGYASVAPWKPKAAYRYTGESSIYLGPAATGKGLGRALLAELIERSRAAGLRELIAVVADQGRGPRSRCTRASASGRSAGWVTSATSSSDGWARSSCRSRSGESRAGLSERGRASSRSVTS